MLCANTILFYVSDLASVDFRMVEKLKPPFMDTEG